MFLASLGIAGALFVRAFLIEVVVIPTGSMEPTIPVGTRLYVNKAVYRLAKPKRGEIVVFPSPVEKKDLVKRLIALEGDEVKIEHKKVVLNGQPLDEPYVEHRRADEILVGDDLDVGRVPPGKVFVLGDNRDQSGDSRDWKDPATGAHLFFVPVEKLKGRLIGVK